MKILVIERVIEPGGAVTNVLNAAHQLKKLGHQVRIATIFVDKLPDLPPEIRENDYRTPPQWIAKICRKNRLALTFIGPLFLFGVVLKSAGWADVLNPNTFPTHWLASLAGIFKKKPVVWSCYEPYIDVSFGEAKKVGWLTLFISLLARSPWDKIFVKGIDEILVISKMCQGWVSARYGQKGPVNYPGIDFSFYSRGRARLALVKYKLQDKFILLNVGVLAPMKNQEVLLESLVLLKKEIPNAVLLLVGEGPMRGYLKQRVKQLGLLGEVKFLGAVYGRPKVDLYAAVDIFLFPSVKQSWGMAPFEALCSGTPVTVSSDCGAAEVIKKEKIGLVVSPLPRELAKAIFKLYKNPKLARELGRRGRKFVKENLTWQAYAQRLEQVLKEAKANYEARKKT